MGRWKGSPQGPYWDANDDGPNQVDPPPGASPTGPQAQQPQQQAPQDGSPQYDGGGIIAGRTLPPWMQNTPDAGPGGMTGRMPGDLKQWPGGQPGGVGIDGRPVYDPGLQQGGLPPWLTQQPGAAYGTPESVQQSNERYAGVPRPDPMHPTPFTPVGYGQSGGPMDALTQPPDFAGQLGGLKDRFAGSNGLMGRLFNKMDIPQAAQGLQNQWQQKTDLANKLQAADYKPSGGMFGGALSGLMSRFGTKR